MHTLAIVDDEILIRKGLSSIIDWKEIGFDLVGCFEDGKDVLDYLETHPLDVILCDICMLNVSGLEVAKYIYEKKLPTEVFLLSAHKEFELAKKAIQYQVSDYILKPTNIDEVRQKFINLKVKLDKQRQTVRERDTMMAGLSKTVDLFYHALIQNVPLSEGTYGADRREEAFYLHGNAQVQIYLVEIIRNGNSREQTVRFLNSTLNRDNDQINVHIIYREKDSYFFLAWSDLNNRKISEALRERIDLINSTTDIEIKILRDREMVLPSQSSAAVQAPQNLTYQKRDIFEVVDELINENISDKITLEGICKQIYMSPSYFSRYFKQKKGIPFSEYLLNKRIDLAKQLLLQSDSYVYKICDQVGIQNYKYFYKVFKKAAGCSPAEYKKQMLEG